MTDFIRAEVAIRQLHARYVDAVWRKDFNAFGDCFIEDAEWNIVGMKLRGRAAIIAGFEKFMDRYERVLMVIQTPVLEVGNGVASGRTYVTEHNRFKDGRTTSSIGVYFERFIDNGDRWRFAWRHWDLYYRGPVDLSGSFFPFRDYGSPPGMPGPNDPATPPASQMT